MPIINHEIGMEKQFFAVATNMVESLNSIGITVTNHVLYFNRARRLSHRACTSSQNRRRPERV
jgi:hypothetical protein